jgi:ABC-type transporter Mla maintaining outer membrane lipid asymmetry ATPase subunit MlaF
VERGEGRAVTPLLSIRSLIKRFGEREVLRGVSLDVASGEFLTILGESGSGKTTLLRMIAGFEQPDSGEIWMGDERLEGTAGLPASGEYRLSELCAFPASFGAGERCVWTCGRKGRRGLES